VRTFGAFTFGGMRDLVRDPDGNKMALFTQAKE